MKQYRITLGDHTFEVKVLDDPRREQVRVEVDGETFTVEVEAMPAVAEVSVGGTAPAVAPPSTAPTPAAVARLPKSRKTSEVSDSPGSTVTAPLPGVIKSIAVRPGQRVAADDELLVIEAMKMDNVIRASRGGTVGTIHVSEGRQVAYGESLLDFAD
jgi:biotin carboxyl carrier protein